MYCMAKGYSQGGEGAGVRVEDKIQYCYCGKLTRVGRSPMHIAQA
jgi:hypothetical protein